MDDTNKNFPSNIINPTKSIVLKIKPKQIPIKKLWGFFCIFIKIKFI